jgi:Phosphodiester glycosidase
MLQLKKLLENYSLAPLASKGQIAAKCVPARENNSMNCDAIDLAISVTDRKGECVFSVWRQYIIAATLCGCAAMLLVGCSTTPPSLVSSPKLQFGEGGLQCCEQVYFHDDDFGNDPEAMVTRGLHAIADVNEVEIVVPGLDKLKCPGPALTNEYLSIAKNWRGTGDGYPVGSWSEDKRYQDVRLFINANFFQIPPYVKCGKAYGWTVSNGEVVSNGLDTGTKPDALLFFKNRNDTPIIVDYDKAESMINSNLIENAVSGYWLLKEGRYLDQPTKIGPHFSLPRTVVGLSTDTDGRRLMHFVVVNPGNNGINDGQPVPWGGATTKGLAEYLKRLGIDEAINLDGAGSSQFLARVPNPRAPKQVYTSLPSDVRSLNGTPVPSSVYRAVPIFLGVGKSIK